MKHRNVLLSVASMAILAAGCASFDSYRLGSTLAESDRYVYLAPVLNESDQATAARELQKALTREILREGTLKIVGSEAEATTRLDVVVTSYEQDSIAYAAKDTSRPTQYRMTLTARVSFRRLARPAAGIASDVPIFEASRVSGRENFPGGSDSSAAKLSCLPLAAKALSETIVENCANAW
ncbi:MAG: LptE family protein [Kiritimatiellae bacterium]|nr:LptE family protein [Kiritimatiellia bacterium]